MSLFGSPNIENLIARRDVRGLIKALNYKKDIEIQKAAAIALGNMKEKSAIKQLISLITDENEYPAKKEASKALVKIGAPAVKPLLGVINKLDYPVQRRLVMEALGEIEDPQIVGPLLNLIKSDLIYDNHEAIETLVTIKETRVLEILIARLKDKNESKRTHAAQALSKFGDIHTFQLLLDLLDDENKSVRNAAENAIIGFNNAQTIELLIAALRQDYYRRLKVVGILGKIEDARTIEPLITALDDVFLQVQEAAAVGLEKKKDVHADQAIADWKKRMRAIAPLRKTLSNQDSTPDAKLNAITTLGYMKSREAAKLLFAVIKCDYNALNIRGFKEAAPFQLAAVTGLAKILQADPVFFHNSDLEEFAALGVNLRMSTYASDDEGTEMENTINTSPLSSLAAQELARRSASAVMR